MVKNAISAGGVIIKKVNDHYDVLLLRDKNYDDWILPKGHVEGDETLEETALREIHEEAGVLGVIVRSLLGSFQRYVKKADENKTIYYYLIEWMKSSKIVTTEESVKFEIRRHNIDELPQMFLVEQIDVISGNIEFIKKTL